MSKKEELTEEEIQARVEEAAKLRNLGNGALSQGNLPEAQALYTRALRLTPDDARIWSNRSLIHCKRGHYGNALYDAEKAMNLAPQWPKGYFRLGAAMVQCGDYYYAQQALKHADTLSGGADPTIKEELAKIENKAGWLHATEEHSVNAGAAIGLIFGLFLKYLFTEGDIFGWLVLAALCAGGGAISGRAVRVYLLNNIKDKRAIYTNPVADKLYPAKSVPAVIEGPTVQRPLKQLLEPETANEGEDGDKGPGKKRKIRRRVDKKPPWVRKK